jgi:succinyl-diaminopimelate desuccinylase
VPAVRGDACLIGEPSGAWAIGVGEKGVLWLRIAAAGAAGHAAYGQGESASEKMRAVLDAIAGLHGTRVPPAAAIAALIRRQRPLVERHWGRGTGAMADRLTVNTGTVRGGGQVNLIPAACEAEVDLRLPPGTAAAEVERDIRRCLRPLGLGGVDLAVMNRCDPYVTPPDEPLVRLLQRQALAVCGREPLPVVRLGYTDGRFFRRAGIPTAIYGPAVRNMGGPDESVNADELAAVAAVHIGAILEYLGGGGGRG